MDNSFSDGSVADFYAGRSIFVTGGTGFLGQVLIEKLLRSCNRVGNIYILVRDKKNEIAEQRLHTITEDVLFDKIRNENPQSLKKLIPVRGDLTEPRLIVSDEQYDEIIENVSVVFHVGATVKFNEPLKQAMSINFEGTRKIVSLCHKLKKLVALLHMSTAYCNTNKDILEEIVYPPPATLEEVYSFLNEYGDEDQEKVAKFLKDKPNTYTFTKHLGEYEVFSNSDALPAAIIRPSVVTPIMDDPISGWLDSWNGTTLYLLGISKGQIRFLRGDGSKILDLIPVDMVANISIVAATRAKKKDLKVYNCCSGPKNPLSYNKIAQTTIDISLQRKWNDLPWPFVMFLKNRTLVSILQFIFHFLPAFTMDCWLRIIGKRPRYLKLYEKYNAVLTAFDYFVVDNWIFKDENVEQLLAMTSPTDRLQFYFDPSEINWTTYIHDHCIGIYKYMLKTHVKCN